MISTTLGRLKLYNKTEYSYVVTLCAELVFQFMAKAPFPVPGHQRVWHHPLAPSFGTNGISSHKAVDDSCYT